MRVASSILVLYAIVSMAVLGGCGGGGGGGDDTTPTPSAPGAFTLMVPVDEATEVDRQPNLTWQAAAGASAYSLLVADSPGFETPIIDQVDLRETSYALPSLLEGSTNYFWRVTATNADGTTRCSADLAFTTRALAPPTIVEHPQSLNVAEGHSVELNVGATGLAPMSYQWQRSSGSVWSDIIDAVGQTLTVPPMTAEDGAMQIRCIVTNTDGQAESNAATLSVRRVLMVRASAAGLGNGTSWNDAFINLQDALTAAVTGVDEIWVAAGTYTPGALRTDSFQLVANVAVYGGFNGTETAREDRDHVTNQTILSGEIGGVDNSDNAYHVVRGANAATLDGFTISGGNADSSYPNGNGGGMFNDNCNPIVTNCIFSGNSAFLGGGMQNDHGSPIVTNCTFIDNTAANGGGLHNLVGSPTITNCTFSGNSSNANGAGLYNDGSSPTITNCTFSLNSITSTTARGGGVYSTGGGTPIITGCTFSDNSAPYGGGMGNGDYSSPVITSCIFSNNAALYNGGGMVNGWSISGSSNPTINNSTFSGNTAEYGGGMYNNYTSTPTVNNCTFSENSATVYGGGVYNNGNSAMTFANCTFSHNSANSYGGGMFNGYSNSLTVSNSVFSQNNSTYGGGMFNHSSSPTVINCTFSGNSANQGGGICNYENSHPIAANSIFWGNVAGSGASIFTNTSSTSDVTYSCIQGGDTGTGNIDINPLFVVSAVPGDLRLEAGSPCIDAANGDVAPILDILGNARWDDPNTPNTGIGTPPPDMGAFEYIEEQ